jgi:chemotaxis response regulator CheB
MREATARDLDKIAELIWVCESASKKFFDLWAMERPNMVQQVIVKPENDDTSEEWKKTFIREVSRALQKAILNRHEKRCQAQRISRAKGGCFSGEGRHRNRVKSLATFIGISTGGPQALAGMIPALPVNLSGPVFIVQHMPEGFTDSLARTLDQRSEVTVVEAKNGMEAKAGTVYLAPGGQTHMKVVKETNGNISIRLVHGVPVNNCQPSADVLFRSAIDAYGCHALGIVMTGMGNDGAKGLAEMRQCGCNTAVQSKESCVVFGMPGESVKVGAAEIVLPLNQIAGYIARKMGGVYEHSAYAL